MNILYTLTAIEFAGDKTTVRLQLPCQEEQKYPASISFDVTPEHGRALSQYIGEECQLFAVPTSTIYDNVVKFRERVK